jgi:hypothetical protein
MSLDYRPILLSPQLFRETVPLKVSTFLQKNITSNFADAELYRFDAAPALTKKNYAVPAPALIHTNFTLNYGSGKMMRLLLTTPVSPAILFIRKGHVFERAAFCRITNKLNLNLQKTRYFI